MKTDAARQLQKGGQNRKSDARMFSMNEESYVRERGERLTRFASNSIGNTYHNPFSLLLLARSPRCLEALSSSFNSSAPSKSA
mmetsp:Transcript_36702/g.87642  ORF Transcript_36702/g.87642 Transcript_36702/m.87642 type:complete len:83 (-) Transcript_36702:1404-1652(-)